MELLVSTEWLAIELGASDLRIVDATWHMPDAGRNAAAEYEGGHIPGAVFMDLAEIADSNSSLPNMLPPPEKFASRMQSLGLGDGSRIVVYDDSVFKSATRAWWMLTLFGAHDVAILDGGLAKWKAEDRPLENSKPSLRHRHFTVWKDDSGVKTKADMLANLHSKDAVVVDARGAGRFTGEDAEPRPEMASGHVPGSRNLPYSNLFNADGTWKQGAARQLERMGPRPRHPQGNRRSLSRCANQNSPDVKRLMPSANRCILPMGKMDRERTSWLQPAKPPSRPIRSPII